MKKITYTVYQHVRDKRGVNDFWVSKETGLSPSVFTDWRKGRYLPKIDKFIRIANVLNIPLSAFFEVDGWTKVD